MAKKRASVPEPVEVHQLSPQEIDRGITIIQNRIDDLMLLEKDGVLYNDGRVIAVASNVSDTIRKTFGPKSPEYHNFAHLSIHYGPRYVNSPERHRQKCFMEGIKFTISRLEGLISRLEEQKEYSTDETSPASVHIDPDLSSCRVFIVHGHDEAAKEATARFLEKCDLEPIILHEQPNKGRTIIEKFEDYSDVAYAVVLLTPDDLGSNYDSPDQARSRARQNVIFELGFFIGKLGRDRVCALYKGDVEILSDYTGVVYVDMDVGAWKLELAREIKASGIEVDMNLAF